MKKAFMTVVLLAGSVAGYSQGLIQFNLNYSSAAPAMADKQAIYNTQAADVSTFTIVTYGNYTTAQTIGSSTYPYDDPIGSTVYTGDLLSGTGYDAELLIGPAGSSLAAGTMLPFGGSGQTGGSIAHFLSGPKTAGFISGGQVIQLPTQPGYAGGDVVEVAVTAWNNEGGTVNTLLAAQQADAEILNSDPWGISNVVQYTLAATGGVPPTPPLGIMSFSLGVYTPEPSTIVLGAAGAFAFRLSRRK